jgi:hypothetical protein
MPVSSMVDAVPPGGFPGNDVPFPLQACLEAVGHSGIIFDDENSGRFVQRAQDSFSARKALRPATLAMSSSL